MVTQTCWSPLDTSCCATEWDAYSPEIQQRAEALAVGTLRALTGYRIGGCPVTVRPCRSVCAAAIDGLMFGWNTVPINWSGAWFNCMCVEATCGCGALCEVELPGPVGSIEQVLVDGVSLDPSAYRVDEGRFLVRTDGTCWPDCQDLAQDTTAVGTFAVTYVQGLAVDTLGQYAAGLLACEYAKACSGAKCRLPGGVTDITRQGISMRIEAFPGGLTGIREVDAYVAIVNPNHLTQPSTVWTPERSRLVRTTTSG